MAAPVVIYIGAKAPSTVPMVISAGDSGVDLSTVTAASFSVLKPDGTEATWTGSLSSQSSSSVTVTYTMPGTSPIDQEGDWKVYASLTMPTGVVRSRTETLRVLAEYG